MFNTKVIELLPPGVTYVNTTVFAHINGYGNLSGPPAITTSTVGSGSTAREKITWDFKDVLPLNSDTPQSKAMKSLSSLELEFVVEIVDCDAAAYFAASNKEAWATAGFDPPCNSGGTPPPLVSPAKILAAKPFTPYVKILKEGWNVTKYPTETWTSATVAADPNDVIEWRITLTSVGDYKAKNVTVSDILPTNVTYEANSSKLNGSPLLDGWITGYNLGDMPENPSDVDNKYIIRFRAKVDDNGCTSVVTKNVATVKYGCCTADPMLKTGSDSGTPGLTTIRSRPVKNASLWPEVSISLTPSSVSSAIISLIFDAEL